MKCWNLVILVSLMGCSLMPERSYKSGYGDGASRDKVSSRDDAEAVEQKRTAYELGYNPKQALSEEQLSQIDRRQKLRMLERRLESKREKEQYSRILPWLQNDDEKIEFLSIPTVEGRQAWAQQNEIAKRSLTPNPKHLSAMEEGDIAIGMPQEFVKRAWGEPQERQFSGNQIYKNERWRYTRYVTSSDGYKKETRFVYFEGGKVTGWETE